MLTDNLKALLKQHGVSQAELARLLSRDKSVVTNLLQGKRQLKLEEARVIAEHLGIRVNDILGEKPEGFEAPALIPFQHAPERTRKSKHIVEKDGKFYLEDQGDPKAYALEIKDDSLNLAGYLPGDIVVSVLDKKCKKGDVVVVQHYLESGAETILRIYQPPYLQPHSTNPHYRSLHEQEDDVRLVSPVVKLVRLL